VHACACVYALGNYCIPACVRVYVCACVRVCVCAYVHVRVCECGYVNHTSKCTANETGVAIQMHLSDGKAVWQVIWPSAHAGEENVVAAFDHVERALQVYIYIYTYIHTYIYINIYIPIYP